ncbi:MAG: enoyl-CoA hydratase/isomerase family protein [Deltaproteobacteria bacterium]|jgi:enoyl-CoA hydratase/carnithine racemase|nr:enoyl-CoA hydratase/isomerase family protein [Deltaproteobacteria bacterium]
MTRVADYHRIDLTQELEGVRFELRDRIAFITLARPDRGNSLSPAMQAIFRRIWSEVRDNDEIRVAVLSAEGDRHFCTGFDVVDAESDEADDVFSNRPVADAVFWSPYQNRVMKPVICAVNGLCVGGGHHFVVDADIVLASENAAFTDTHVNVGMVGALENIGLARRLPIGSALRMTLMGRHYRMPAGRAYQLGLVDELYETPKALRAAAEEMARQMLENSPQAMALSKEAIWGGQELGYADALAAGWNLLKLHWSHPDFAEGPRAFAEKRAPRWNPDPNARDADGREGSDE